MHSVLHLSGQKIVHWVGTEMALGGGNAIVTDETLATGWLGDSPVLWEHPAVPFLQFTHIDIQLASGQVYRMRSQYEDGSDFHGLYLVGVDDIQAPQAAEAGSTYRTRELVELPTGEVTVTVRRQDGPASVVEAVLSFGGLDVRILAAEVHEQDDGDFKIIERDEAILIQLGGGETLQPGHWRGWRSACSQP